MIYVINFQFKKVTVIAYWTTGRIRLSICQVYASRAVVMAILPVIIPQSLPDRDGSWGSAEGERESSH